MFHIAYKIEHLETVLGLLDREAEKVGTGLWSQLRPTGNPGQILVAGSQAWTE